LIIALAVAIPCLCLPAYRRWRERGRLRLEREFKQQLKTGGAADAAMAAAGEDVADSHDVRWNKLDAKGYYAVQKADLTISRTVRLGVPVGQTPAGNYVGVYWQYGTCHPVPAKNLVCTAKDGVCGYAAGYGTDDVGSFKTYGSYKNAKLMLAKKYTPGTGDPKENLGHTVQLRLTCCQLMVALPRRAAELRMWGAPADVIGFYGTWHIRLPHYKGDGEMCLWLPPAPVVIGYKITRMVTTNVSQLAVDQDGDGVADMVQTTTTQSVSEVTEQVYDVRSQVPFAPKEPPIATAVPMGTQIV